LENTFGTKEKRFNTEDEIARDVFSPSHYAGDIECIDGIRSALTPQGFVDFCRGTAIAYLWRATRKEDGAGGRKDLAKASWYTSFASGRDPRSEGK
tara:strand:+ start:181 stop:468 length:288 start_codon:yes stop_codon:yes gene_type:complete